MRWWYQARSANHLAAPAGCDIVIAPIWNCESWLLEPVLLRMVVDESTARIRTLRGGKLMMWIVGGTMPLRCALIRFRQFNFQLRARGIRKLTFTIRAHVSDDEFLAWHVAVLGSH